MPGDPVDAYGRQPTTVKLLHLNECALTSSSCFALCFVPRPCFSGLPHRNTCHLLLHSFVEIKPIQSGQHVSLPGATPETKELGLYQSLFPNLRLGKQYLSRVCALKCLHISCCTTHPRGSKLYLYRAGGCQCSFSSLWAL